MAKKDVAALFEDVLPLYSMLLTLRKVFSSETEPTQQTLFAMVYSIFYLNGYRSIKNIFDNFIDPFFDRGLSGLYYTVNESKLFIEDWPANLLKLIIASGCVDSRYPIFIAIDDSLVEKKGESFEYREKLFDHAGKNGGNYLNGHCFVSVVLQLTLISGSTTHYVRVPLMHRMWIKDGDSKLKMGRDMVLELYKVLAGKFSVCLLCDSWYPKGEILELHTIHNIPFICSARVDTALYELPTEPPAGKRGPKPKRGKKLSKNLEEVFSFEEVPGYGYLVGHRKVVTDIFGTTKCSAFATKPKSEGGSINLFLATDDLDLSTFDPSLIYSRRKRFA